MKLMAAEKKPVAIWKDRPSASRRGPDPLIFSCAVFVERRDGHGRGRGHGNLHGGGYGALGMLGSFRGHGPRSGSARIGNSFSQRRFGHRDSKADGWQGYGWYDCRFVEAPTLALALNSPCNEL